MKVDKDGSALSVVKAKRRSQVENQAGQRFWEKWSGQHSILASLAL